MTLMPFAANPPHRTLSGTVIVPDQTTEFASLLALYTTPVAIVFDPDRSVRSSGGKDVPAARTSMTVRRVTPIRTGDEVGMKQLKSWVCAGASTSGEARG